MERSSSEESSQSKPSVSANSKPHLKQKDRRKKTKSSSTEQPAPLSSGENRSAADVCQPSPLNKRDRMKLALAEGWGGHSWIYTSERADGACVRCQKCDLGVQQNCTEWRFNRLITHPCKAEATMEFFSQTWRIHASHDMKYVGPTWECKVCGRVHRPGAEKPQQALLQPCSAANVTKACKTKRAKAPGLAQASAGATPAATGQAAGVIPLRQAQGQPDSQTAAKKRLFAVPVQVPSTNQASQSSASEVVGPGAGEPVAAVNPSPSRPKPKPKPKTGSLKQTKLFFQ